MAGYHISGVCVCLQCWSMRSKCTQAARLAQAQMPTSSATSLENRVTRGTGPWRNQSPTRTSLRKAMCVCFFYKCLKKNWLEFYQIQFFVGWWVWNRSRGLEKAEEDQNRAWWQEGRCRLVPGQGHCHGDRAPWHCCPVWVQQVSCQLQLMITSYRVQLLLFAGCLQVARYQGRWWSDC